MQAAQHVELLLLVDRRVLLAQLLVHARELGREIGADFCSACPASFCIAMRDDVLELLGNVLAQRVDRRRRRVHDLVQQLGEVAGAERPDAGEQLVHHRAERIEVGVVA